MIVDLHHLHLAYASHSELTKHMLLHITYRSGTLSSARKDSGLITPKSLYVRTLNSDRNLHVTDMPV